MNINIKQFQQEGFFIHAFEHTDALKGIFGICEQVCKEYFPNEFTTLENYHLIDVDKERHDEFQYQLFTRINESQCHRQFVKDNITFFTSLFGPDLDVQTNTYVRVARPGSESDNIGMHRDTDYGNSAYEVSMTFPLVNQEEGCGISVIPKSHLFTEHEFEQVNREDVERGTFKNEMGFLYAPKKLLNLQEDKIKCVSLPFGSALGFTLGLIHGQKSNTSNMTRWSIDFRVKNSFHPMSKNLKQGYYSSFNDSSVNKLAKDYYKINIEEKRLLNQQMNEVE